MIFLNIAKIKIAFKSKMTKSQQYMHAIISEFTVMCLTNDIQITVNSRILVCINFCDC